MPSPRKAAEKTVLILQENGHTALFAGGCVRDIILHRKPKDYDIATSALPHQVESIIPDTKPIGKAFGVIQARVDGFLFEIATFRSDKGSTDGRHPDTVSFSNPRKDAMRRDFTVNAIFLDPVSGEILDFVHGIRDIKRRVIRSVGSPSRRFSEDHLRMLRAVRFSSTLGFRMDSRTSSEIQRKAHLIKRISHERIREEFSRILQESPGPGKALRTMHRLGLLQNILPETCRSSSNHQLTRLFLLVNQLPGSELSALLTALTLRTGLQPGRRFTNTAKDNLLAATRRDLQSLRLSKKIINHILGAQAAYWLIRSTGGNIPSEYLPKLASPQSITAIDIIRAESEIIPALKQIYRRASSGAAKTRKLIEPPLINGNDLKDAGIIPGPEMKILLHKALALQAQGKIRTKQDMLRAIRQS